MIINNVCIFGGSGFLAARPLIAFSAAGMKLLGYLFDYISKAFR